MDSFHTHGAPFPIPRDDCSVCFFENPQFSGSRYCLGPRSPGCDDVLVISAPSTIGSIQFNNLRTDSSCDLVANIRVLDPPYGRHIDSFSVDVPDTAYSNVVQEFYVENAGRACFLAAADINKYGKCYNSSIGDVEPAYRDTFYEALLFKTERKDFDLVAYELAQYGGLLKQFIASSDDFSVADETLQMHVRSVKFIENSIN